MFNKLFERNSEFFSYCITLKFCYPIFITLLENRVLRRIFGPKRDEVVGEWRKLYSGELHNLYMSPDIIRQIKSGRMRWAGHVARVGEGRKVYRVLVGKPEEKRPLER
jgi:hypothetical protein